MNRTRSSRRTRLCTVLLAPALLTATACSGDDGPDDETPEGVLAEAKQQLDETSGVSLDLSTEELPQGVDGVLRASGVGTHAPAFEGDLTVLVNSLTVEVPVVAVDGQVFAQLPFTTTFEEINPGDYSAPDPATLMDPASGISSWLVEVEGVEAGEESRDGDTVLTSYTGTLPGSAVASVIPSAAEDAEFDATFRVDDDNRLDTAVLTGPFYGDAEVEYTIALSDYGTEQDITAP